MIIRRVVIQGRHFVAESWRPGKGSKAPAAARFWVKPGPNADPAPEIRGWERSSEDASGQKWEILTQKINQALP